MSYVRSPMRCLLARAPRLALALLMLLAAAAYTACDRRTEPYDPTEPVEAPDLSRIFPEGARVAAERDRSGAAPAPAAPAGRGTPPPPATAGAPIRGTLELAAGLEGSVPRGGVLFLIARRPGGGGPPVAVKRVQSPTFPMDFELGPDDRMIQAIPFAGPLLLTARVDGDGNATSREPGDLSGAASGPVDPGATGVTVRIDHKL